MQTLDILRDCTADVIVRKKRDVFDNQSVSVPLKKLVSVGTDGASVMTGNRGGVVTLLKRDNSHIIGIYCFACNLALCTSQTAEDVAYMNDIRQTLIHLFYFFSKSAKRTGNLTEISTRFGILFITNFICIITRASVESYSFTVAFTALTSLLQDILINKFSVV